MLLRSSSGPIPSSCVLHSHESLKTRSVSNPTQSLAGSDLHRSKNKNCKPRRSIPKIKIKENDYQEETGEKPASIYDTTSIQELFSISGLDKGVINAGDELQTLVMGGGMGRNGGHGNGNLWDYPDDSDHTDAYYQKMIEANPDNALLLANYAKFLKEVCGDYPKAEEYLERAILANPGDGDVLSLYADLIWQTEKNVDRAEGYYDQAVKSAPNDCYVLASYAKFLWDVEEDEEDKEPQCKSNHNNTYPAELIHRANHNPRLSAAS